MQNILFSNVINTVNIYRIINNILFFILFKIELTGLCLELVEDRPSANITSPGPIPVKLTVPNLLPVTRDKFGVFHIGHSGVKSASLDGFKESEPPTSTTPRMVNGNQETRNADIELLQKDLERTLRQLNSAQEKNAALEKELESTEVLKMMVAQLQDQVSKLQDERSAYLNRRISQPSNHL